MKIFEKIAVLAAVLTAFLFKFAKAGCPPGFYGTDDECRICPPNYYCPGNTTQPFQCPPGFMSYDGEAECTEMSDEELEYRLSRKLFTCTSMSGYYCSGGNSIECPLGKYCTGGSQIDCPEGYKCPRVGTYETCPTGYYSNAGVTYCSICPAGSYCSGSPPSDPVTCSNGYYSLEGSTSCTICPAGYKCATKSDSPVRWDIGTYRTSTGGTSCTTCPAGSYCPSPISGATTCASGYYSQAGWAACKPCPAGYSCSSGIQGSACSSGYYSEEGVDACTQCPAGSYCPLKDAAFQCVEGYYSNAGATSCTICDVGYYCTGGVRLVCPHHYYTDQTGMSACRQVPPHWYTNSISAASSITECGIDQYTDGMHLACYDCDDAHQCFKNDQVEPCPYGWFKEAGQWYCKPCEAGKVCTINSSGVSSTQTISAYESALSTANKNYPRFSRVGELTASVCPPNNYCSDDGVIYHICPHGTYPYITGCANCPADTFCMTSFNRQVAVTTGSESSVGDSFPRFQPQGYVWTSAVAGWSTPKSFRSERSALGRVGTSSSSLSNSCPQGYSCTHSIHARCPSSHQGKIMGTENIGMIAQDQNIIHNYETLSGLTYTKLAVSKVDDTYAQCLPCNGGYSCSLGNDPVACVAGKYSPTGENECFTCPPGYYCLAKSTTPTACGVNTYNSNAGSTTSGACSSCPTGYYAAAGSAICEPCPGGYTCSTGTPVLCPIGTYSTDGEMTCSACQAGYMCDKGSKIKTPPENICPKGSYCSTASGVTLQYKCPKGTYGLGEGATASSQCITCPPGYVCREGTDDFTKYPCPQGNYCPAGTSIPSKCPAGTYNAKTGGISSAACITWPAGYFCPIESKTITICPVGYYCPSGTSSGTQYSCPAGTYSGTKTGSKIQSECFPCTIGNYCPAGATTPTPAPEGYYIPYLGATSSKAAIPCPPGYPCTGTGNYDYKGFKCSKGHYCPTGTSTPVECPAGTYTDREDLWSKDQCTTCPATYYCLAGSAYANLVTCPQGYYCPAGTGSATQYPCPTGTYGDTTGLKSDTECKNCTAGGGCAAGSTVTITCQPGYYCPAGTTTATPEEYKAPAGSYISKTGAISEYDNEPCGLGYYCPTGSTAPTQWAIGTYSDILRGSTCKTCPAGYYWDVVQMSAPKECSAGFYSDSGASACTRCPEGYYCHQKATSKTTMLTQTCPAGTICSMTVSGTNYGLDVSPSLVLHACPAGKYCEGGYAVATCPAGTYNPIKGRTSSADCLQTPAGFYTLAGATEYLSTKCAAGYYCLAGSTTATQWPCPAGTFRGITGGRKPEDCAVCKSGYVCATSAVVTPSNCGAGNYCPLGTIIPELCPVGTYSAALNLPDSRSCTKCPTGFYCGSKGMTSVGADSEKCDAGFYCIEGATRPDPTDGITGMICPAGGYCLKGATSVSSCPSGKYNPEEGAKVSDSCIVCLPGKYCFGSANPAPTGSCTEGYYCPAGSSSPTQMPAPAGYYAPTGSDFAIPCPRGTYQPSDRQPSCINCPAGAYCPDEKMTATQACPAGYYCPANTYFKNLNIYYEPQLCPVGTYNPFESKTQSTDCLAWPAGKYCGAEALSAVSGDCSAGYYCATSSPFAAPAIDDVSGNYGRCPTGKYCAASTSSPTSCLAGTYSKMTKSVDNSNCKPCEPGYYCATAGLSAPTGQCTPGYYCAVGSTSATAAECTATNYCPQGSPNEERCPIGFYNTLTKQGSCTECEAGFTCFNGEKADCPKGYYCP